MTYSATTRGLQELASLRQRITRDYGVGRISWDDFAYCGERLAQVEERLVELASRDPRRIQAEHERDSVA